MLNKLYMNDFISAHGKENKVNTHPWIQKNVECNKYICVIFIGFSIERKEINQIVQNFLILIAARHLIQKPQFAYTPLLLSGWSTHLSVYALLKVSFPVVFHAIIILAMSIYTIHSDSWISNTRSNLLEFLQNCLLGDMLAAEYLLCCLLSSSYDQSYPPLRMR